MELKGAPRFVTWKCAVTNDSEIEEVKITGLQMEESITGAKIDEHRWWNMKNGWECLKKWMKYGWIMDSSGWNWVNIDAEKRKRMKNGWKLDGNGNIEHAWNDYIRIDEQGLNRIKLDGEKQWILNGKWIEVMDIYINI